MVIKININNYENQRPNLQLTGANSLAINFLNWEAGLSVIREMTKWVRYGYSQYSDVGIANLRCIADAVILKVYQLQGWSYAAVEDHSSVQMIIFDIQSLKKRQVKNFGGNLSSQTAILQHSVK